MDTPRIILRSKTVQERTGYSRVQVWRKANDPNDDFPDPVQLGANAIGWFEDEIAEWQATRPRGFGRSKTNLGDHYRRGEKDRAGAGEAA